MADTHGIAVFDVCGTITKTNNTSAFIGFVLARTSLPRYGRFLLIRILSSLSSRLRIRSKAGRDRLRDCQIALLRGYSANRLEELAERYVNRLFTKDLLNHKILESLRQEKERGQTVALVSAAVDPPIAALARRLGLAKLWSSQLEIEDGRCTGRLQTDLLGRKTSVLDRIATQADLRESCVYSDNVDDAAFMANFGTRHAVLNTCRARRAWGDSDGPYRFIANYDAPSFGKDPDSVNERTVRWTYVPSFYYGVSRFHREGVLTLLLRELVPATLAAYLLTDWSPVSLILMPLSFWMFYAVYEIGGLVNDLLVQRETAGTSISRIAAGVHLHVGPFVAVRVILLAFILALLPLEAYSKILYTVALCSCLAIYLLHTLIVGHLRILTFLLLKFCRNTFPLLILASRVDSAALVYLGAIFFLLDAPAKMYVYAHRRALVRGTLPVSRLRRAHAIFLGGLGAVLYAACGSPWLFAMASYHVMLEGLWLLRSKGARP